MSTNFAAPIVAHWRVFSAAPHRMFFASGLFWLLALSAWWALLLGARQAGLSGMEPAHPALLVHGAGLLYLGFTPFMYGFLLTVFPRWMPAPPPSRPAMLAAMALLNLGGLAFLAGLAGAAMLMTTGWLLASAAKGVVIAVLATILLQARERVSHAWAVLCGLAAGLTGMLAFARGLLSGDYTQWPLIYSLGLWGFLLVVYFGVCHRMIPFFSSRVVSGYVIWRPDWLLASFVVLALTRAGLQAVPQWAWLASVPLAAIALVSVWRWRPRQRSGVRLLAVLHISLGWLATGLVLAAVADLATALGAPGWLGRAPLHALGMGFFGGMLMAMVTRVTMGHSGRPLTMDAVNWWLFLGVQAATVLRVTAELLPPVSGALSLAAALTWLAAFGIWAARVLPIYLRPRVDGAAG